MDIFVTGICIKDVCCSYQCNICDFQHDPSPDLLLKTENHDDYGEGDQI